MKRTRVISLVVAVFVLLAIFTNCSKTEKKQKELTDFNLGYSTTTAHLLAFIAVEEGFFQEDGLAVTLTMFGSTPELIAGLESGKLDAAFIGGVGTVTNKAAGHDITVFGGAMSNGHGYVLESKFIPAGWKEGDISVLKGRNIAAVKNTVQDYELQFLLRQNGIEIGKGPDKVNIVYFGGYVDTYNAITSDEIDGGSVASPFSSIAKNAGHTVVYYCNNVSAFENQPCCRQVALTKSLSDKKDTYIAFERALIKAYKFSQENHAKTIEDVAKYIPVDKKDIEYEVYGGFAFSHPDPDKKATATFKKNIVEFGYTNGVDYDIDKLYNLDIYRKALEQILAENPNDPIYKLMEERFKAAN